MLFPFQPEVPITERLRFLTDIFVGKNGSEQRDALRYAPRQEFDYTYLVEDDIRAKIENLLFGNLNIEWDVPVWSDSIVLNSPAVAADTSVSTYSTGSPPLDLGWTPAYNDFRAGDSAFIFLDDNTNEKVDNITITDDVIGFASGLVNSYPAGAMIMPVRPALISAGKATNSRYAKNLTQYNITFRLKSNVVDLSDITAFDTFNSAPILNDPNWISGQLSEGWNQKVFYSDGNTGTFVATTFWDRGQRSTVKTFQTQTRQRIWEVRRLLHWLHGQQKVMYLPTFGKDLFAQTDVSGSTLIVRNDGYTAYSQSRAPRSVVQLVQTNGTKSIANVISSTAPDAFTEVLTLDASLGTVSTASIDRISVVEPVRLNSDDITITYTTGVGNANIVLPVQTISEHIPAGGTPIGGGGSGPSPTPFAVDCMTDIVGRLRGVVTFAVYLADVNGSPVGSAYPWKQILTFPYDSSNITAVSGGYTIGWSNTNFLIYNGGITPPPYPSFIASGSVSIAVDPGTCQYTITNVTLEATNVPFQPQTLEYFGSLAWTPVNISPPATGSSIFERSDASLYIGLVGSIVTTTLEDGPHAGVVNFLPE